MNRESEMTDNVIHIEGHKKKRLGNSAKGEWQFSLEIFRKDGQWGADIIAFNQDERMEVADRIRLFAEALDAISFSMKIQAEDFTESERGPILAAAYVYKDSTVRVRVDDRKFTGQEQKDWLCERFDDAKEAAFKAMDEED